MFQCSLVFVTAFNILVFLIDFCLNVCLCIILMKAMSKVLIFLQNLRCWWSNIYIFILKHYSLLCWIQCYDKDFCLMFYLLLILYICLPYAFRPSHSIGRPLWMRVSPGSLLWGLNPSKPSGPNDFILDSSRSFQLN